jgi:hypothetical protein
MSVLKVLMCHHCLTASALLYAIKIISSIYKRSKYFLAFINDFASTVQYSYQHMCNRMESETLSKPLKKSSDL